MKIIVNQMKKEISSEKKKVIKSLDIISPIQKKLWCKKIYFKYVMLML